MARPIVAYIARRMRELWGVERLLMDKNQPHVLKYDDGHTGVELHHDKCDITGKFVPQSEHIVCWRGVRSENVL
jgi:hypothetical protein